MELAQESVVIHEQPNFKFRLECDPLQGIIRLSNYRPTKTHRTRITRRNVPIDIGNKWKFYKERSGWSDTKNGDLFTGSYISKNKSLHLYSLWEKFMRDTYRDLREHYEITLEI